MSQAPMMPVFTDALLGDTLHLSAEEFGAYCLLLFATWRNNGRALAEDDRKMARICRVSEKRWRERLRPALAMFFDTSDGTWHQKRLEKEWNHVEQFASEQSRKGRLSALKRWGTGVTDPPVRLKPNGNPHTHTHKEPPIGPPKTKRAAKARTAIEASWIPCEEDRKYAVEHGHSEAGIEVEAEKFRDHHLKNASMFADWCAAWRTWIQRAPEFALRAPPLKPNGNGASNGLMNYDEPWPQRVRSWKRDGVWMFDQWGPRPGEPGCRAPPELVA
jgi:uncharacterized protein YdaU (DUF1376 family)